MHKIEVDSEVYEFLEKKVEGFKETPNSVLRRILNIPQRSPHKKTITPKSPTTNIPDLIRSGYVSEGQEVFFRDKQGNKVEGIKAYIHGDGLLYQGKTYSMSGLTAVIMDKIGQANKSRSYRGPQFWYLSDDINLKDLWEEYVIKNHYKNG